MFLDEELEQIHNENLTPVEKARKMQLAWCDRLPKKACSRLDFANALKRIDSAWRMFCDRHKGEGYKEDGFRNLVKPKEDFNDKTSSLIEDVNRTYLHWWKEGGEE